jgi:hypothetical protein
VSNFPPVNNSNSILMASLACLAQVKVAGVLSDPDSHESVIQNYCEVVVDRTWSENALNQRRQT